MNDPSSESRWYILTFIPASLSIARQHAQHWISLFNSRENTSLEVFAPRFIKYSPEDKKESSLPLTFHYVFVKGTEKELKRLCAAGFGFIFVLNKTKDEERYATISEADMLSFKIIASHYSNALPYFSLEDTKLEEGDLVEVIDGDFPGLKGRYFPKPKSPYGSIILKVSQNLGTVVYDIHVKSLRILEFAKGSRRCYDRIDAILPLLNSAQEKYRKGESLTEKEITELTIFHRRMERVKLPGARLRDKLSSILTSITTMLG